jgi:hypothetical protein
MMVLYASSFSSWFTVITEALLRRPTVITPAVAMGPETRIKGNPGSRPRCVGVATFSDLHTINDDEEVMAIEVHYYAWSDWCGLGFTIGHH